jgi:hypothetical protein
MPPEEVPQLWPAAQSVGQQGSLPGMQPCGQPESAVASRACASGMDASGNCGASVDNPSTAGASIIGAPSDIVLAMEPFEDASNAHPASASRHNPRTAGV